MNIKRTVFVLALVSLFLVLPASAKKEPGDVPAPEWVSVELDVIEDVDVLVLDWTEVAEAEKYALSIYGVVLVDYIDDKGTPEEGDDELIEDVEVEWCVCYSSVDHQIAIPLEDLAADVEAAIAQAIADAGIAEDAIEDVSYESAFAKVKGLDPHDKEDMKRQNNTFSEPYDLTSLDD